MNGQVCKSSGVVSADRFGGEPVESLYKRLVPRLVNRARGPLGFDDARSIADLSFVKAYRRFDPSQGVPFEAWAFKVLHGEVVNELRSRSREVKTVPIDGEGEGSADPPSGSVHDEDHLVSAGQAQLLVGELTHAIAARYKKDERLRGLHLDVMEHLISREFQPERLDSPDLKALAAQWGIAPPVVSQARARIKQLLIEILQRDM